MNRILLTLCFFICYGFQNSIQGQYAIAGTTGSISHIDIIPDTLLSPILSPGQGVHQKYYFIDINKDGSNDIQIKATGNSSAGAYNWNVEVSSLNSFTSFALGSKDSTYTPTTPSCTSQLIVRNILKRYIVGDTIKNTSYISAGYLGYRFSWSSCFDVNSSQWLNINDAFIGVKYQTVSDIHYGWIKVNVDSIHKVLIKEFALGLPSGVGLNPYFITKPPISLYPNPSNGQFTFTSLKNKNTNEIYNYLGKLIYSTQTNLPSLEIDLSAEAKGVYFYKVLNENNSLTHGKIIIQ